MGVLLSRHLATSHSVTVMTPAGGLIVAGASVGPGLGGLLGGTAPNYGFGFGATIGFGGAALARPVLRARFGEPTAGQTLALRWAIATELTAFLAIALFGHAWTFGRLLLAVLVIVSAHFLVMTRSHGPMMLGLGLTGLMWLAVATLRLNATIGQILVGDGLIKFVFGAVMIGSVFRLSNLQRRTGQKDMGPGRTHEQ